MKPRPDYVLSLQTDQLAGAQPCKYRELEKVAVRGLFHEPYLNKVRRLKDGLLSFRCILGDRDVLRSKRSVPVLALPFCKSARILCMFEMLFRASPFFAARSIIA